MLGYQEAHKSKFPAPIGNFVSFHTFSLRRYVSKRPRQRQFIIAQTIRLSLRLTRHDIKCNTRHRRLDMNILTQHIVERSTCQLVNINSYTDIERQTDRQIYIQEGIQWKIGLRYFYCRVQYREGA